VEHWQDDRVRVGAGGGLLADHLLRFQALILIQGAVLNTTRQEVRGFADWHWEAWSGIAEVVEGAEDAIVSSQVEDTEMAQEDYNRVAVDPVHMCASGVAGGHEVPDSHAQVEPL
jgi:hypothetical protein